MSQSLFVDDSQTADKQRRIEQFNFDFRGVNIFSQTAAGSKTRDLAEGERFQWHLASLSSEKTIKLKTSYQLCYLQQLHSRTLFFLWSKQVD